MSNTKYRFELFSLYDGTGVARHLEKMAAKGWMLERIGRTFWHYKAIEPKKLHFSTTFLPWASSFDPDHSEEKDIFYEFCESTGWIFAAGWERMQIFYNEQEQPVPLDTDPATQLHVIHRAIRASLITFCVLAAISLFLAYGFIGRLITDPVGLLADSLGAFTGLCSTILLILCCAELFTYYRWRRKAKQAAEQGSFFPTKGINVLSAICLGVAALGVVYYLLSFRTGYMGLVMILYPLAIFLGVRMGELIKKHLKKRGAAPGNNRATTAFTAGITAALLTAILLPILFNTAQSNPDPSTMLLGDPPVDFASLTGQTESYSRSIDYDHSFLFTEYSMTLRSYPTATEQFELEFTVTKSNLSSLDNWCKEQILDRYSPWLSRNTVGEYRQINATSWGTSEVWQFCDETGAAQNHYLLCYEDHYVELIPGWELTNEQMTAIAEMLQNA